MALTSHFSSRRETHRLCTMKCWFSPSCKDCVISSFRSLIPRPRFSLAANGLPLQLPSSLLLPDDKRPPHWSDHLLFYFTCFFNFSPEYVNFYLICFATDKKKCNYVYEIIFNRHMDLIAGHYVLYRTQNMVVKEFPKLFKVMQLKNLYAIIQENSIKRLMYDFLDSILVLFSG